MADALLDGLARLTREAFLFDARDIRDFGVEDLFIQGLLPDC